MEERASLELLHAILSELNLVAVSSDKVNPHIRFFDLSRVLKSKGFNMRISDFELALEKLEEDKYVKKVTGYKREEDNIFEDKEYPAYAINFNGQYFLRTENGYVGRQRALEAKISSNAHAYSQDRLNQKLLVIGAFCAAVGAIGLVVWEMGVHFSWW